jgi:hypothetical protein
MAILGHYIVIFVPHEAQDYKKVQIQMQRMSI